MLGFTPSLAEEPEQSIHQCDILSEICLTIYSTKISVIIQHMTLVCLYLYLTRNDSQ